MDGIVSWFTRDHRACDELWAAFEQAVADRDAHAPKAWRRFDAAMRRHIAMEEEVLFPAFEEATGMVDVGPPAVMRMEHAQMRGLLDQAGNAVAAGDLDAALDQGDTLLMLIQQHNAKEEGMLYPMAEQVLGERWTTLRAELDRFEAE